MTRRGQLFESGRIATVGQIRLSCLEYHAASDVFFLFLWCTSWLAKFIPVRKLPVTSVFLAPDVVPYI